MKKSTIVLIAAIFVLVIAGVYINVAKELAVNRSKLPEKVIASKGYQRWITNLKNKELDITSDEFRLLEENEIYNTKWMQVYSMDQPGVTDKYNQTIEQHQNLNKVIYSPSKSQFIDYRHEERDGYHPNEVHYYGLRDTKLVDARILDCSVRANCYFDRAFFLDNDVFVISEVSRNISKNDLTAPDCGPSEECTYTFKVHVIDLNKNSRLVYESKPFKTVLDNLIKQL
ncbi:MAG TPA: hypothetical protein VLI92_03305 [Candidatus Saccharimonadales bacterium]|nr:hypothetical protein [Candidatus Saccharimonadales bacterium]